MTDEEYEEMMNKIIGTPYNEKEYKNTELNHFKEELAEVNYDL